MQTPKSMKLLSLNAVSPVALKELLYLRTLGLREGTFVYVGRRRATSVRLCDCSEPVTLFTTQGLTVVQ